jgi:hypothetical protein
MCMKNAMVGGSGCVSVHVWRRGVEAAAAKLSHDEMRSDLDCICRHGAERLVAAMLASLSRLRVHARGRHMRAAVVFAP